MAVALDDDEHAEEQRARYAARRAVLRPALEAAGWKIEHSTAGLYLWASNGTDCWEQVRALAGKGILVAPGDFYGKAGDAHIRIAVTASDERDQCGGAPPPVGSRGMTPVVAVILGLSAVTLVLSAGRVLRDHASGQGVPRTRASRREPPPAG